ncbi:DUF1853 family protein [Vreelandella azerica]|uniref:DUF1853 family protein n=1 Tax=Vreelandella azerica TaxID=2732867 RepID=UPI001F3477DC|nr:DUF1853 family protein [Halomonas azerica]
MRHFFLPQDDTGGHTHSATLEGVPSGWRSSVMRDMAWLLNAPDLVTLGNIPGRPSLATLGLQSSADIDAWLHCQQDALHHLPLRELRHARMGHYHERLWHYLLDHAPGTRLLARNVRIFAQRNTRGELDMLYRTCQNPTPIHLEVAIKFYLGLPDGPGAADSQSRWIGPGGFDSLDIKRYHMQHRQLPLSTTADARRALRHWLTPRDSLANNGPEPVAIAHQMAMPGILYYPWHADLPPPEGATPEHRRGIWCHASDWPALAASLAPDTLATWLTKPHWLAPPPLEQWHSLAEIVEQTHLYADQKQTGPKRWPQQLMCYTPADDQTTRIFIVPNQWPTHIPLPAPP